MALATRWQLGVGEHPSLAAPLAEILNAQNPFVSESEWAQMNTLGLPLQICTHGHHVLADTATRHAAVPSLVDEFPLAPLFVRDLAGRVIHTGLLPLPSAPATPVFPAGCYDVPATMVGAGYIESTIFTAFQLLEVAPPQGVEMAGSGHTVSATYAHPERYPYKIRPLTFYADGWRLPQVARLFVRAVPATEEPKRNEAARQLMAAWESRPQGQNYDGFYEANNGAIWFEELFLQGVTIIPTFEGYNGVYDVAPDFSIQNVEAGRAVNGLHTVVGRVASSKPAGTIIDVKRPGYATRSHIEPAEVVVSSGPSMVPADALIPNLALPHPHVAPVWGACWLPTQLHHFAEPALWDWSPTGVFWQVAGPLWCPQHYVYGSTATIVRQARKPVEENTALLQLPEKLKSRFHPALGAMTYDALNERTRQERMHHPDHPLYASALDSIMLPTPLAGVGYHALPAGWPAIGQASYLSGTGVTSGPSVGVCPPGLAARLAPQVTPLADSQGQTLLRHHVAISEPARQAYQAASRGILASEGEGNQPESDVPAWLPDIPASELMLNVKRLFASRATRQALSAYHPKLPAALFRFKEAALGWRRLRYRLFVKYPALWNAAHAPGQTLVTVENQANSVTDDQHTAAREQRMGLRQVGRAASSVPADAAPPLRKRQGSGKLKPQKNAEAATA
jgi:hypothetical protein